MIGEQQTQAPTDTHPPHSEKPNQPDDHHIDNSQNPNPQNPHPPVDPEPKFKAKIYAEVDNESRPTLCDTGCQRSCISENFLRRHPKLYKNQILPHRGKTVSIDGSKVETVGVMNIAFRIKGRYLRMNCRVVRNLVYDFVLGWDFFSKYKCSIHPSEGYLTIQNEKVNLISNSTEVSGTHFSLAEDTVIPAHSKVITRGAFYINPDDGVTTSDTVEVEPLPGNISKVAIGRGIAKVKNGTFAVELLNPYPTSLSIKSDVILGHVSFTTDEDLQSRAQPTGTVLSYACEDSNTTKTHTHSPNQPNDSPAVPKPSETHHPAYKSVKDKPPDADTATSKVKIDYSTIADDAKPHLDRLQHLLEVKHAKAFSTGTGDTGRTDIMEYHANIKPGPPIAVPPYRATPDMQKEMDKIVHEMLADGMVSHSTSAFSAPVLLVPKKLGGWRFVTDFRKLNARCERVVYPLPRIEDSLQKLREPCFFSTMDLQKGFWQVPIAKEDRKYFAFSTGTMHVEYNVMPMGALNSSSTMQALMALILRGLPPEHIICFLDDILVASSTMEEHLLHLDQVLDAFTRAGLKLNPKKCLFAQAEVTCLGHRLSRNGIGPDPANLDKIRKWKAPTSKTEIRQFLGLTGYYRQMIQNYAEIAAPLTDLTKNEAAWTWSDKEQKAFETLRDQLTSSSVMAYPDFSKPFWVKSDASGSSVGYVLTQKHDNKEKVIAYGSKKLTDTQRRYSTYDREFFGILTAVRTYSHYLRHGRFYVVTDHRPLLNLKKLNPKSDATGRRVRWSIELNLYNFEILYKKGRKHSDADAMSRLTDHEDYAEEEELAGFRDAEEADTFHLLGMDDVSATTAVELISDDDRRKELAEAQDADHIIREVKELVRKRKHPRNDFPIAFYRKNFSLLAIKDNILYRKGICGSSDTPILQAIIPPNLTSQVLQDAHGSIFAGHPGYQRLVDILHRHVTWPGIYRDAKNHVIKCVECDRVSQPNPPAKTELKSINPEFVFEHVCCDLIQLPDVPSGWKYICVFMDVFSRHVTFYKFKDKTTLSFARALEDYVTHVGCPQKLTCDNGAEFCSELVDAVTKIMGIKKRTSVVYRPQSQGMVERMNRQIIDQLTKRLQQYGKTWPEHMQYVALAHNAAPASRTGESPNLVFFGRELPLPTFTDLSIDTLRGKSVKEYAQEMQRRVKSVHDAVRAETVGVSAKTAEAYNRKAKHQPLGEGELVYYRQAPKDHVKTQPKWIGPVAVVQPFSPYISQVAATRRALFPTSAPLNVTIASTHPDGSTEESQSEERDPADNSTMNSLAWDVHDIQPPSADAHQRDVFIFTISQASQAQEEQVLPPLQQNALLLPPPNQMISQDSPSSTPDASHDTVRQISPSHPSGVLTSASGVATPETSSLHYYTPPVLSPLSVTPPISGAQVNPNQSKPSPNTHRAPQVTNADLPVPEDNLDLHSLDNRARNSFEEFLDTTSLEIQLFTGVGNSKMDVIDYKGFEFRRDRRTEVHKYTQLWVCRYARKFKCKGKFKLTVKDLNNVLDGAELFNYVGHTHEPYTFPYGQAHVSMVESSDPSSNHISSNNDSHPSQNSSNPRNAHAISEISASDFVSDFGDDNLENRASSSPIASGARLLRVLDDEEAGPTIDIATVLGDGSNANIIRRYKDVPQPTTKPVFKQKPPSSTEDN